MCQAKNRPISCFTKLRGPRFIWAQFNHIQKRQGWQITTLFRQQVLEERKTEFGNVLVAMPPSLTLLSVAVCAAVSILVTFLCWAEFARKETVHGYLVPDKGLVKVMPPFTGTVVERHVDEGEAVKAGELLYVIAGNRGTRSTRDIDAVLIAEAHEQRQSLLDRLEQAQRMGDLETGMLEHEIIGLEKELAQADEELAAQAQRLALSEESLESHRHLLAEGHLSRQQLSDKQREHLALRAAISGLQRNRLSLLRQRDAARARMDLMALETATRVADYEGRIAEMNQRLSELDARAGYAVRAPVSGIATNVAIEPGQAVTGDAPLLALLPEDSLLEARIHVPTRAAGFVKAGAKVVVRYDAFPYQRFGLQHGIIQRVSRSVLMPDEMDTPVRPVEPGYAAVVRLERQRVVAYGEELPLKPGMLLQADIVLDRQSLFRWLLDPLLATTGSL